MNVRLILAVLAILFVVFSFVVTGFPLIQVAVLLVAINQVISH
jgi:hypothetical protein